MLPFGQKTQQQQQQQQQMIVVAESTILKRWQNLSNWQFRSLFFVVGITASNFARPNPSYFWLYVVGVGFGALALMFFPPSDGKYQSLWRTAGISLCMGALLAWWDLLKLLQWWHFVTAGVLTIFGLFVIGSGGNRK